MNTDKKKPSLPAEAFTSEDIKQLREYVDALDALTKEEPQGLTYEEFDEAWDEIQRTGKIPEKYKGRIA